MPRFCLRPGPFYYFPLPDDLQYILQVLKRVESSTVPHPSQCLSAHLGDEKLNEFYKKGCQEESSAPAGASKFLVIQPTIIPRRWGSLAFDPFS
jgi:hypothetical protein